MIAILLVRERERESNGKTSEGMNTQDVVVGVLEVI